MRHFESVGPSQRRAIRARAARLGEIEAGRFGLRRSRKVPTLRKFVEGPWRNEVTLTYKPSTLRSYNVMLRCHLLPAFGDHPLSALTRAAVKAFIASKARQQRASKSQRRPNPNRPMLSRKTILNMVALLASILEVAVLDYELLPANPLRGILRRRNFPTQPLGEEPVRILEPDEFKRSLANLKPVPLRAVLFAAFSGLRWSEQTAVRIDEEVDLKGNRLRITRSLYKRVPQVPKTRQSVRRVVMTPIVRRIVESVPWKEGYVFPKDGDGRIPLANGNWLKEQWRQAQADAGVRHPIRWHDLRHQFVSMLIAIGKSPKYIAEQAGRASAGFTFDRYGHLFETITPAPAEWPEDLLWPSGCHAIVTLIASESQRETGEQGGRRS